MNIVEQMRAEGLRDDLPDFIAQFLGQPLANHHPPGQDFA